jgi:hypothetical protein
MSSSPSPSTANRTSDGRIAGNTRPNLTTAWTLAVVWNLVSAPILFIVPSELEHNRLAALAFLFPLIGAGLLVWAVMLTLRWRRFGASWFDMSPQPASPGGTCAGRIRTRLDRPDASERFVVTLKLTCLERTVSGSGKNRSVHENILWREEQQIGSEHVAFTPAGASIPVHFPIPADARETTAAGREPGIFWVVAAEASLTGVDLHEDFDIPVHRVSGSAAAAPAAMTPAFAGTRREPVNIESLARAGIRVRQTSSGTEYRFAAGRNPSFALGTAVFTLIWSGALWLQLTLDFPWIFPIITGLFELLLLVVVADVWLGVTTVTIGADTIRRRHTVAGVGSTRTVASRDIVGVGLHISMQSTGRSGTPYYEIRATRRSGRRVSLGRGIRNKAHAEWLADRMRTAIGVAS